MSSQLSLLNVTSSSESEDFNLMDIQVFVNDKEQPWFKWIHVRIFWGLVYIQILNIKLANEY